MSLVSDVGLPYPPQPPASVGGLAWWSGPADSILAIVEAALAGAGMVDDFPRIAHVFGEPALQPMSQHANGQVYIWWVRTFWGKAGVEQYQWAGGEIGKMMFRTAEYRLRVALPWPVPKGTTPPRVDDMLTAAHTLESAAAAIWAAFQAVLGGGYKPAPQGLVTDGLLMGPAEPNPTRGGVASFDVPFAIQL